MEQKVTMLLLASYVDAEVLQERTVILRSQEAVDQRNKINEMAPPLTDSPASPNVVLVDVAVPMP